MDIEFTQHCLYTIVDSVQMKTHRLSCNWQCLNYCDKPLMIDRQITLFDKPFALHFHYQLSS